MTDPGFIPAIIGYAVTAIIQTVIRTTRDAVNCGQECQMLAEELDKLLPRVQTIERQLNSGERKDVELVKVWLGRLKHKAQEANIAVHKYNSKSFWPPEVAALGRELKDLHAELEKLEEIDTLFPLQCKMDERLSRIECSLRHHSSPPSLGTSTSFHDENTQAPITFQPDVAYYQHSYSSVGSQSFYHTAQGCHQPGVQRIASLDDIRHTRHEAKLREEETRRRQQQQ
jgi:hypothetical protein